MSRLSPISSRELIEILLKIGFKKIHQKGSHLRLIHGDGRKTTVPVHSGENIGRGLLRKILRDANLSRSQFQQLRNKNPK